MKIYAVVYGGYYELKNCPWKEVKPLVHRIKGTVVKAFDDISDAEKWARAQVAKRMTAKVEAKHKISKNEAMRKVINTPHWKKNLGKAYAGKIELEQGFRRGIA